MSAHKLHSPRHDDLEPARFGAALDSVGEVTSGADVAGMIGPAGVTHLGDAPEHAVDGAANEAVGVAVAGAAPNRHVGVAVASAARNGRVGGAVANRHVGVAVAGAAGGASEEARSQDGGGPTGCSESGAGCGAERAPGSACDRDPDRFVSSARLHRAADDAGTRAILHVDIDAFFAHIEQVLDPRLAGKPVIVGAGVIASCSYEARAFGLKAGMTLSDAKRLCPKAIILEGHAQTYRCFAERIFGLCREVAPAVETYLDEAYCDLSGTERLHGDLPGAARALKRAIHDATGLTVTCGLGPNRMLAKLVGKTVKPDGFAALDAADAEAFLRERPVEQLAGVGHAHAKTLRSMNVKTIGEMRVLTPEVLAALFGAPGRLLYERCRGGDTAPVLEREVPQSIGRETSFHRDTADRAEIEGMIEYLVGRACRTARELEIKPRTVTVRVRYSDGEGDEQARGLAHASDADPIVLELALATLRRLFTRRVALHLVGVTLSNFVSGLAEQGSLFDEAEAGRRAALYRAFDGVRSAFGHGVLVSGRALHLRGKLDQDRHGFVLRTPSLTK